MAATTEVTKAGNTYVSYDGVLPKSKDGIRAFVPTAPGAGGRVVWAIHGFGSSHDALLGGYLNTALALVDAGYTVVCPNLGGSYWSAPKAQTLLKEAYGAVVKLLSDVGVSVTKNVMLGTSHGGCMAFYATAKALIPNIAAIYTVNGVYNPQSTKGSYGSLMPLDYKRKGGTSATNPANLSVELFKVPVRVVYDETDPTVNPGDNSKKVIARFTAAKKPIQSRIHNSEHHTPGGTGKDIVTFLQSVLG